MSRLRVLHVITTLPRVSGAADNTRWTVNLLDRARYEVHLAFGPSEADRSSLAEDVKTFVVENLTRPISLRADPRAFGQLHDLIHRERYDIVHTHNSKAGVLGRLVGWMSRTPVLIHTAHTISFVASDNRFVNQLYRTADQVCARVSDCLITVSTLNTQRYLNAGIGKAHQYRTVYSGVDTNRFLAASGRVACRADLGIHHDHVLITWIGRLNRQKDPLTFLRACALLAKRFPNTRFLMIGEDSIGESLEKEVKEAIQTHQLGSVLRLLGYRTDVDRILAASDLVLHSSLYEGLGRSIVEAMLVGVPIVATAVDGVREAILPGERGGLLVEPRDPQSLADGATYLIEHPEVAKRMALAGRSWARDHFDVRTMVTTIDQIYQEFYAHWASQQNR
jgi:glycosyltransferase involved in cell wall biosynthesis